MSQDMNIKLLSHPSWQCDLIRDIGSREYIYLPADFEDELRNLENEFLSEEETIIINDFYIKGLSTHDIALELYMNDQSVREKKKHALSILREHSRELATGKEYMETSDELQEEYKKHCDELAWLKDAIAYVRKLDGEDEPLDAESDISDEAKKFYRINGFTYLADVMGVDPEKLFVELTNKADDEGVFLAVSGDNMGLEIGTPLADLDFKEATLRAFYKAGYETVGDLLSLSEDEIMSIPGVGLKQIVHLYRRVLFG